MVADDDTVTPAEHAVLAMLRKGPALLGPRTEAFEARRFASPGNPDGRRLEPVRLVETQAARRLAKAGLVVVEHGEARLTPGTEPFE